MKNTYSEQKSSLFDFPTAMSEDRGWQQLLSGNSSSYKKEPVLTMQQAQEKRERDKLWDNFHKCVRF